MPTLTYYVIALVFAIELIIFTAYLISQLELGLAVGLIIWLIGVIACAIYFLKKETEPKNP